MRRENTRLKSIEKYTGSNFTSSPFEKKKENFFKPLK